MRFKLLDKILKHIECPDVKFKRSYESAFLFYIGDIPDFEIHIPVSLPVHDHFINPEELEYINLNDEQLLKEKYNINIKLKYMQRYALSILHEIGHYKHYLEIGYMEYDKLLQIQKSKAWGYKKYRELPLEKYADNYAIDKFYEIFLRKG